MKTYFRREFFILRCFAALLQRNFRKYFTVGGITYWLGASGLYKAAKPTYFFCRYVDDLADGDRALPSRYSDFANFIDRMKALVHHPVSNDLKGVELILVDAIRKLNKKTANPEIVEQELIHFLESMLIDYDRRLNKSMLTQKDIDNLYKNSFSSVLHLTFIGTSTQLDREYITLLGLIQGKLYALQDFAEDLTAGIINIPAEVIQNEPLTLSKMIESPMALERTGSFQQWRQRELRLCQQYLYTLQSLDVSRKVRKIISILTDPLAEYLKTELPGEGLMGEVTGK